MNPYFIEPVPIYDMSAAVCFYDISTFNGSHVFFSFDTKDDEGNLITTAISKTEILSLDRFDSIGNVITVPNVSYHDKGIKKMAHSEGFLICHYHDFYIEYVRNIFADSGYCSNLVHSLDRIIIIKTGEAVGYERLCGKTLVAETLIINNLPVNVSVQDIKDAKELDIVWNRGRGVDKHKILTTPVGFGVIEEEHCNDLTTDTWELLVTHKQANNDYILCHERHHYKNTNGMPCTDENIILFNNT